MGNTFEFRNYNSKVVSLVAVVGEILHFCVNSLLGPVSTFDCQKLQTSE
jgi:hypothetical protein